MKGQGTDHSTGAGRERGEGTQQQSGTKVSFFSPSFTLTELSVFQSVHGGNEAPSSGGECEIDISPLRVIVAVNEPVKEKWF